MILYSYLLIFLGLLPYGDNTGDYRVPAGLDISSGPITLQQNFTIFGSEENIIFVSVLHLY